MIQAPMPPENTAITTGHACAHGAFGRKLRYDCGTRCPAGRAYRATYRYRLDARRPYVAIYSHGCPLR